MKCFCNIPWRTFTRIPSASWRADTKPREILAARRHYPQPQYALFDGCALPFPDQSFDLVFSNAVIEHILGPGRQEQFAKEIMRVGKSWFVTTPNFWYPFETHHHLPFFQFLPRPVQMQYNRLLGTHIPKGTVQELGLLSARAVAAAFPPSRNCQSAGYLLAGNAGGISHPSEREK